MGANNINSAFVISAMQLIGGRIFSIIFYINELSSGTIHDHWSFFLLFAIS